MSRDRAELKRRLGALLASALGGALYFLGYLGFGWWPLLGFFLLPLWWALESTRRLPRAVACGFVFGGVAFLGGHDWLLRLVDVFLAGDRATGWGLFGGYGLWFAAGYALYGGVYRALRNAGIGFATAAIAPWLVLEWLHPLLFPVHAGAGLIDLWPLVQIADLGGPLVLSLQLLLVNAALFRVVEARRDGDAKWRVIVAAAIAMLVGSAVHGGIRERQYDAHSSDAALRIGLVQANLGTLEKRRQAAAGHRAHLELSRELVERDPELDLLIWPETAYARAIAGPLPVSGALIRRDLRVPLLFGAPLIDPGSGDRAQSNSAFLLDRDGTIASAYRKNLLIPLAESIPFARGLPHLEAALPHAQSFAASETKNALVLDDVRIAVPICYEAVRPAFVRELVNESRAQLIVTLANDAWFGDSREPRLHLGLARLRAIEHRRHLVRATNSGISAFVDPLGRIEHATGVLERATLEGQARPETQTTLFASLGHWPGPAALTWLVTAAIANAMRVRSARARGRVDR